MPPVVFCSAPGCNALVAAGRCAKHAARGQKEYDARRGSAARRGYDATWRKFVTWFRGGGGLDPQTADFASAIVARNRCAKCGTAQRLEFDHVQPLRLGGARLDPNNIQPLCASCHARKRRAEMEL